MIAPAMQESQTVPMLDVQGVHKQYRRGNTCTPVLQGVNFRVDPGEFVFLAGPSGSGKSTLLAIIGSILTPDRGIVRLLDRDVSQLDAFERAELRRDQIGFVFQKFQLIRGLTAFENVVVPRSLQGETTAEDKRRASDLLEQVGLGARQKSQPNQMSVGECQRVALARALMNDPQLVLADEPTASLDAENGRRVIELLKELTTRAGKTAIVVSHDERVFRYASRVCHMKNGTLDEANQPTQVN